MEKKTRIMAFSSLAVLTAVSLYLSYEYEYIPIYGKYYFQEDDGAYGRYSKGKVYIGDADYIEGLQGKIKKEDVLIVMGYRDEINKRDPNAMIISSYEIKDRTERLEILRVLQMYEADHPSDWDRSLESTRVEWTIHNILYDLHIKRDRTQNTDLNNSDEEFYKSKILQRLIK